jgi:hypothetical protein
MPAPRWLARFNLQVTNRLLGPLARHMPGMGVVVHVGRKAHRQYRTPVLVFRRGDRLIIALTYGHESQMGSQRPGRKRLRTGNRRGGLTSVWEEVRSATSAIVLLRSLQSTDVAYGRECL